MLEYQEASTALPRSLEPVTPSDALKSRVLAVAVGERAPRPATFTRVFWAAAAVILISVIVSNLMQPDYERFDLAGAEPSPAAQGYVLWSDREVKLHATGLARLPADKVYELWRIREGKVLRAGEYAADENGRLKGRHLMNDPFSKGDAFAVTIESVGGKDAPTGPMPLTPGKSK